MCHKHSDFMCERRDRALAGLVFSDDNEGQNERAAKFSSPFLQSYIYNQDSVSGKNWIKLSHRIHRKCKTEFNFIEVLKTNPSL